VAALGVLALVALATGLAGPAAGARVQECRADE
jgi:hypothetical protein